MKFVPRMVTVVPPPCVPRAGETDEMSGRYLAKPVSSRENRVKRDKAASLDQHEYVVVAGAPGAHGERRLRTDDGARRRELSGRLLMLTEHHPRRVTDLIAVR
jgi:hypothetical protein